MLSSGIKFKSFKFRKSSNKYKKILFKLLDSNIQVINSLSNKYKFNYTKKSISKFKKNKYFRLIGMGGSILGTQAIYDFLNQKVKKKFLFIDNLKPFRQKNKKKYTNLIVSKSGNTIETIVNANILISKKDKNLFITENNPSYLYLLAEKLKAEIIHHNNYIGGRYSVLSEVGMLPAELMGLNPNKFKQ